MGKFILLLSIWIMLLTISFQIRESIKQLETLNKNVLIIADKIKY